jgi:hypothetical protein
VEPCNTSAYYSENNADIHGTTAVSTTRGHHKYRLAYHYNTSIRKDSILSLISLTLDSVTGFTTTGLDSAISHLFRCCYFSSRGPSEAATCVISHTVRRMMPG